MASDRVEVPAQSTVISGISASALIPEMTAGSAKAITRLLHAHQRQIDEPRLRRNKTLDLRAHRAGIEIVDDVEPRGIVDEPLMRLAIGGRDRRRIGRFRDRL